MCICRAQFKFKIMRAKLLCVEDSEDFRLIVGRCLKGFDIDYAEDLAQARERLENSGPYDLLLMDIELPDGNGLKFYSEMFTEGKLEMPAIFLTSSEEVENKILAFHAGADDYVCKPIDPRELRARVDARLRINAESTDRNLDFGNISLDLDNFRGRMTSIDKSDPRSKDLDLTGKEFRILRYLMENRDRVVSRAQILDKVWGPNQVVSDRSIDTHLSHIRKKILGSTILIEAVANEGYRLQSSRG